MKTNNINITKLMLTEFFELTKSDIEIQINKNYDALRNLDNANTDKVSENINEVEGMIKKFYSSLSNYFSKNTGSDFANDNYASVNSFKKNYMKFLKYNEQTVK